MKDYMENYEKYLIIKIATTNCRLLAESFLFSILSAVLVILHSKDYFFIYLTVILVFGNLFFLLYKIVDNLYNYNDICVKKNLRYFIPDDAEYTDKENLKLRYEAKDEFYKKYKRVSVNSFIYTLFYLSVILYAIMNIFLILPSSNVFFPIL